MLDEPGSSPPPSFARKLALAFLLAAVSAGAVAMLMLAAAAIVYT